MIFDECLEPENRPFVPAQNCPIDFEIFQPKSDKSMFFLFELSLHRELIFISKTPEAVNFTHYYYQENLKGIFTS